MTLRRLARALPILSLLLLTPGFARSDEASPPTGIRAELLRSMNDAASKLTELASATPQAKYSYQPGKDVRTTAEVFLHVAAANYRIPTIWGVKAPDGLDLDKLEKSTTDKAAIEKLLAASFDHVRQVLANTPDSDWDREITLFGNKTTVRGGWITLVSHTHEHLGQSIAYARANGIVPPWTARSQEAASKKKASGM
jgi:uncharacterized damage-inducible protein DinB